MSKTTKQVKREKRVRSKVRGTQKRPRLSVFRSNKFIYAQLVNDEKGVTIVSVNEKKLSDTIKKGKTKVEKAQAVGEEIARKAKTKKITQAVFDRGAYRYHGRVKAVATGARKAGLKF